MGEKYFIGQGKLLIAELSTADAPQGFVEVANVPELSYSFGTDRFEHRESKSGFRLKDIAISRNPEGTLTFMIDEVLDRQTLEIALQGVYTSKASGTVTDENVTAVHDKWVPLAHLGLTGTAPVVTNVTGTTTYVSGTDYTIDLTHGKIMALSTGTITEGQTLEVDYAFGAQAQASAFTAPNKFWWLRFEGLNELDSNRPVIFDAYKCELSTTAEWMGISEDLTKASIDGVMLATRHFPASNVIDGQYYRIQYLTT